MLFNSFLFLLVFLPVLLVGWHTLNHIGQYHIADLFLIVMSLWFYGSFHISFLIIIAVHIFIGYGISTALCRHRQYMERVSAAAGEAETEDGSAADIRGDAEPGAALPCTEKAMDGFEKAMLCLGTAALFLILIPLKYCNLSAYGILMPVGISFYTFSQISFIADRCRGDVPAVNFSEYVLWSVYFPKMAEGPIVFYEEIASQFRNACRRRWDTERFARSLALLIFGMAKKMLLADTLSTMVSYGFEHAYYMDTLTTIMVMVTYALQLYCDFSGFCDMALGVSGMLGIDLPLNFDAPFQQASFRGFWQKWHMTLTRFFTRYIYIPLGGSRCGKARTFLNVMIVFMVSALWHGAKGTYLIWGLLCGLFSALEGALGSRKKGVAGRIKVFALFCLTLIFFGAPRTDLAFSMLRSLFTPRWPGFLLQTAANLDIPELYLIRKVAGSFSERADHILQLILWLVLILFLMILVQRHTARDIAGHFTLRKRNGVLLAILAVWCISSMTGVSTFIYFQF